MLNVCSFLLCGKIYQQTLQISQIVEILNRFNAIVVNQQEMEDSILTSNYKQMV